MAKVDRPVLIIGERGTGKELAASKLHFLSNRWEESFVAINCASLPQSLVESELFGYEPGAFTGAVGKRKGRFELANKGTLFLDEIGNMPPEVQEKILRVIEYGTFDPIGSSSSKFVDVRIVAATNADLPALCADGKFMRDLLDRLCFEVLIVPPLRERKNDVLILANHFATRMAMHLGRKDIPVFTLKAQEALLKYQWPGNIRECKNVVERSVYRSNSAKVDEIVFDPFNTKFDTPCVENSVQKCSPIQPEDADAIDLTLPINEAVSNLERRYLQASLVKARYNQKKAASLLGLTYHQFRTLYRKYKKDDDAKLK